MHPTCRQSQTAHDALETPQKRIDNVPHLLSPATPIVPLVFPSPPPQPRNKSYRRRQFLQAFIRRNQLRPPASRGKSSTLRRVAHRSKSANAVSCRSGGHGQENACWERTCCCGAITQRERELATFRLYGHFLSWARSTRHFPLHYAMP